MPRVVVLTIVKVLVKGIAITGVGMVQHSLGPFVLSYDCLGILVVDAIFFCHVIDTKTILFDCQSN